MNDDQRRRDLERLVGEGDVHLDILNSPVRYTISSDSLGKFFLMLPQAFTANERIYRQPVALRCKGSYLFLECYICGVKEREMGS